MNSRYDERDYDAILASGNFDEAGSAYVARQLTHIRAQVLETKKAALNAFTVFPVQTDVPAGADSAVQRVYDSVGTAAIISNYADDLPRIDLMAKETAVKVHLVGGAYGWNYRTVQNAQFSGVNLSAEKGRMTKKAIDTELNRLAWKGDSAYGIVGFLNDPNISEYTLPGDGSESSTKLADKTETQILRDLNAFVQSVGEATHYTETVNTLLLPPNVYAYLNTLRLTDSDRTVMEFFRASHPEITRVMQVGELRNASDDGTKDVMIAGYFDPSYVKFEIPQRFDQLPVQYQNLEYIINCVATTIGVTTAVPYAFIKAEGC